MKWPNKPTQRDFFTHRMDMFDPVVTGVGIADAGYADAQPDMSESTDEEVVTAATGYNDIGPDATVDEVSFDAAT